MSYDPLDIILICLFGSISYYYQCWKLCKVQKNSIYFLPPWDCDVFHQWSSVLKARFLPGLSIRLGWRLFVPVGCRLLRLLDRAEWCPVKNNQWFLSDPAILTVHHLDGWQLSLAQASLVGIWGVRFVGHTKSCVLVLAKASIDLTITFMFQSLNN